MLRRKRLARLLNTEFGDGKSLNILKKMPVKADFVSEHEAAEFAEDLAREIAKQPAAASA
jgi:hypothetical protein